MKHSIYAIILAAGKSTRMEKDKLFTKVFNKPLIYYSIKPFENHEDIKGINIVTRPENKKHLEKIMQEYSFKKIKKIVHGGKTRQDSAYEGIKISDKASIVLIHNAANPLVTSKEITDVIEAVKKYGVATAGYPVKDTIKKVNSHNFVKKTIKRKGLWQIQTPQGMKYDIAVKAFEQAFKDKFIATDDVSLAERIGYKVKLVKCSRENIKVTYPEDLIFMECVLKRK